MPTAASAASADGDLVGHLFDAAGRDRIVAPTRRLVAQLRKNQLLWIDLDRRDQKALDRLEELLGLPDDAFGMLTRDVGRARLTRREGYVLLAIEAIESDGDKLIRREVDLVAGANFLVTIHDGPIEAIELFQAELGDEQRFGRLAAGSFLGIMVDTVMSTWFMRVEEIERQIDRLDELALRGPESELFLVEVLRLRRRIAMIRRTIAPHREAFAPLVRPDSELNPALGQAWPGIVDRLERVMDSVENARELLVGSFDIYLGGAAQRSNEVMKALTVLSAVLLPSVVLAGIMGMNFQVGFFDEPRNFLLVVGAMVVFSIGLLAFARFRRWI